MSTFLKTIRKPLGTILPLDEVKRRVIVDALDKCDGNYRLAARLLGIGKTTVYRMARAYKYQSPKVQGQGLMTILQRLPFQRRQPSVSKYS
jgi:DNA-binding NtrC family response regulator